MLLLIAVEAGRSNWVHGHPKRDSGFCSKGKGTIVAEYQLVSAIKAKRRKNFKAKVYIAVGWEGSREVE